MKRYRVTVSYRPNANSLKREEASFVVEANNREVALLRAGWVMYTGGHYHVAESLNVKVELI